MRIARMHLRSLERFPFASVLFPYNHSLLADTAYRADVEELIARVHARRRRPADDQVDRPAAGGATTHRRPRFSWYEPLDDPAAIARAVRYVLADPRLFLISSSDARLLPPVVEAASANARAARRRRARSRQSHVRHHPLFDGEALERI